MIVKSRRLQWAGGVARMETRNACTVLVGKYVLGRTKKEMGR
jgi:hypothetical protein